MAPKKITQRVRIHMTTERYEVAANLFDDNRINGEFPPEIVSEMEEVLLGIVAPETSGNGDYFVKPANPDVERALRNGTESEDIDRLDLYSEGKRIRAWLRAPDGSLSETVAISYDETELSGMEGSSTTITYRVDDPGLVTMLRRGVVRTSLSFRAHHRTVCAYETPYMPFMIGIHAITVDNRLETDGTLKLDYITEVMGAHAERCVLCMTVTPIEENSNDFSKTP